VSIVQPGPFEPMVGDPDDHRPNTHWRLVVDPGDEAGQVDGMALLVERMAVGDRLLVLHGIFPTTVVEIVMLERNPAPGTEDQAPSRTRYDFRTGQFEILE